MDTVPGSIGVLLLLIAFVMNLLKRWRESQTVYLVFNALGATLACLYAARTGSVPFVILEGVWALFAVAKITGLATKKAPA